MAGFDPDKVRKSFAIPENFLIGAVIALGYQGAPASLTNEQMLTQEEAPRQRKPLSEIVLSAWDSPADLG
jgi:hypothetical protein